MTKKEISIIVPVYNAKDSLSECIDSILNQEFKNFELLLIDDGSTDGSSRICDYYKKRDSRIKVIHKKNEGCLFARKLGVELASCNYVGFIDADDYISKDFYKKLYGELVYNGSDISNCLITKVYDNGTREKQKCKFKKTIKDDEYKEFFLNNFFYDSTYLTDDCLHPSLVNKLFKKKILKTIYNNIDYNINLGEDALILYQYIFNANSISFIDESCYFYRINNKSMSNVFSMKNFDDLETCYKALFYLKIPKEYRNYWDSSLKRSAQVQIVNVFINLLKSDELKLIKLTEIIKRLNNNFWKYIFLDDYTNMFMNKYYYLILKSIKKDNIILLYLIGKIYRIKNNLLSQIAN